jgi:hypothetical protein
MDLAVERDTAERKSFFSPGSWSLGNKIKANILLFGTLAFLFYSKENIQAKSIVFASSKGLNFKRDNDIQEKSIVHKPPLPAASPPNLGGD